MARDIIEAQSAADLIADAAVKAAERVAVAAKSAVDSAASAASAASSASQILGAVAISRLDGIDKQFTAHEKLDETRFVQLNDNLSDTKTELKSDIKELRADLKDINSDLKKQTKIITLITGGIIAISKVPDLLAFLHH